MKTPSDRHVDSTPLADAPTVLALLRADISARIRPLVAHLPEVEVATLIENIARIKYKYDGSAALRHTPSRPVEAIREPGRH